MEPTLQEGNVTELLPIQSHTDTGFLHFLKELPAWCVLSMLIVFFTGVFLWTSHDIFPRIIDALVGAVLTALVSNRTKPPSISAGKIESGGVQVTGETSVDNVENVNLNKKE